jgi:hypothetical protein
MDEDKKARHFYLIRKRNADKRNKARRARETRLAEADTREYNRWVLHDRGIRPNARDRQYGNPRIGAQPNTAAYSSTNDAPSVDAAITTAVANMTIAPAATPPYHPPSNYAPYTLPRTTESFVDTQARPYLFALDITGAFWSIELLSHRPAPLAPAVPDNADELPPLGDDSDAMPPLDDDSDEMPPLI